MIQYSFFKHIPVSRMAHGVEGISGQGKLVRRLLKYLFTHLFIHLLNIAALQLYGHKAAGLSFPTLPELMGEKDSDKVNKDKRSVQTMISAMQKIKQAAMIRVIR